MTDAACRKGNVYPSGASDLTYACHNGSDISLYFFYKYWVFQKSFDWV